MEKLKKKKLYTPTKLTHTPNGFQTSPRTQRKRKEEKRVTCKISNSPEKKIERVRIGENLPKLYL